MDDTKKSFYEFCIDTNKEEWLELWDYDLNKSSPKDVYYRSSSYYYFKCKRGIHDSELKKLRVYTYGEKYNHEIVCNQCNSFEQWCLDNEHQDYLDLWDYDLNERNPRDISKGVSDKYYLKCTNPNHTSELKEINWLTTTKSKNTMLCNQCNSFGQWMVDNFGDDAIEAMWSNKNIKSPFEIMKNTNHKLFLICDKGHEYSASPNNTVKLKSGCAVCSNKQVLTGYNDVSTSHPEFVKYFKNKYDALTHTYGSNHKTLCKCPNCGYEKTMQIKDLVQQGFGCNLCGDGISYPEKIVGNLLVQLGIKFIPQLTSKTFDWCKNYRYDFYLPDYNIIIETHGIQHYEESFKKITKVSLSEQQSIDNEKEKIAINNEISHYIVLDCRYSYLNWIKESIEKSNLFTLINKDSQTVSWNECDAYAKDSNVYKAWNLWEKGLTTDEIATELNVNRGTVVVYLNRGYTIGKCSYNGAVERIKAGLKGNELIAKKIRVTKDGKEVCVSESMGNLIRNANELIGCDICRQSIINAIKNNRESKGFKFEVFIIINKT